MSGRIRLAFVNQVSNNIIVKWVERNINWGALLACSLAALFLFTQVQASSHIHLEDNDDRLTPECTFCVAASHLDDSDLVSSQDFTSMSARVMPEPIILAQPAQKYIGNARARAPPVS